MGYGSDFGGGYNEGAGGSDFGGGFTGGVDYSLGAGTVPGLNVGYDTSPGYGFNTGTTPGFNAGGYDIGGGLGSQAGAYGLGMDTDYGFSPSYGLDFGQSSQQGLQAIASPGWSPNLGQSATMTPFSQRDDPGFRGSMAHKALSFLSQFNPITSLGMGIYNAASSKDPVAGLMQMAASKLGLPGFIANTAYRAATNEDPAGYLGRTAAMTGAGMAGGMIAGPAGSAFAREAMGEGLRTSAQDTASIGPYGSASPMEAGFASARSTPAGSSGTPEGGGGRNWTDTLMALASGAYGMNQASKMRQTAQQAIAGSSPWAASGGMGEAGAELKRVISGDLVNDPGFKLAQLSAARAGAQQPGGFAASAAANAAIKYQMERMQALGAPAGVGFSPASGYSTAMNGISSANETARQALGNINFGVAGAGSGTPPWLQSYLIKNGMGGSNA